MRKIIFSLLLSFLLPVALVQGASKSTDTSEYVTLPIFLKSEGGESYTTGLKGSYENKKLWVPVEVLRRLDVYRIVEKEDKLSIFLPTFRKSGDMAFTNELDSATEYALPYRKGAEDKEIEISSIATYLKIFIEKDKKQINLSKNYGPFERPKKAVVEGNIALAFDPMVGTMEHYDRALTEKGTSVISPTWFELTEGDVLVGKSLSKHYVNHYEAKGFQVWPLITNQFDPALTHRILSDKSQWPKISQRLLGFALLYGFKGYNFDFENVNYEDKDHLTAFIAYLQEELGAYGLILSMDVTGYSNSPNWSLVYDRPNLAKSLDYLVLMAYDEVWSKSPLAGPVASYPWVEKNVKRLTEEVASKKIILGIPFYMRLWEETEAKKSTSVTALAQKNNPSLVGDELKRETVQADKVVDKVGVEKVDTRPMVKAKSRTLSIKDSLSYKEQYPHTLVWDEVNKFHYSTFVSTDKQYYIWYEDKDSLGYKLDLITKYQLAGFGAWRKGFEDQETLDFIYSYRK